MNCLVNELTEGNLFQIFRCLIRKVKDLYKEQGEGSYMGQIFQLLKSIPAC